MANIWDERKKSLEEDYFRRKEQEAMEKLRQQLASESSRADTTSSPPRCPKCSEPLEEVRFQEVMVDRCPRCQGIWLDHGELDRLMAKEDNRSWFGQFWRTMSRT